jgi:hypothetical protein
MKRTSLAAIMLFIGLTLIGCGHRDRDVRDQFVTLILSDPAIDGDIVQDPTSGLFTVTQGMNSNVQSVFAGINPVTNAEYRAFLDFPLTGAGGVPGNAVIVSAILDIVINSISPQPLTGTIPIRIDLVSFQTTTLVETDFDRSLQPALVTATITPPISQVDFGQHVSLDVTTLMQEAQRLGLANFQVRILEDSGAASPGLIEITDTTGPNRRDLAPALQVTYF